MGMHDWISLGLRRGIMRLTNYRLLKMYIPLSEIFWSDYTRTFIPQSSLPVSSRSSELVSNQVVFSNNEIEIDLNPLLSKNTESLTLH